MRPGKTGFGRGTYVGDQPELRNKTALLRRDDDGGLLAQFDDRALGPMWAFGWHPFADVDFDVDRWVLPIAVQHAVQNAGEPNRFVAIHYGARLVGDREERLRFGRMVQDRAPLSEFGDWPEFQELCVAGV